VTKLSSLKQGDRGREVVLASGLRGVRVGPRSWVRFQRWDGSRTPWFEARNLKVNDRFVVTEERPAPQGLDWNSVAGVEVNEVDLEESVVGITAGTALVVMAATAEVALLLAVAGATRGHGQIKEVGLTRAALDMVAGEALKRPEEDPAARSSPLASPTDGESLARPLFSGAARRRDIFLLTLSSEGGIDGARTSTAVGGVTVGARFIDLFEVGWGARSSLAPPAAEGEPFRISCVPFLRFGLHLDLTAGRRVALAVGADLGGLPGQLHARFLLGIRARLTDRLQLGLYPWNPATATSYDGIRPATTSRLNLIELSWLL
jgi:hypothetical protein